MKKLIAFILLALPLGCNRDPIDWDQTGAEYRPTISLTQPQGNIYISSNTYVLQGTASSSNGIHAVYVSLDNGTNFGRAGGAAVWSSNLTALKPGDNRIRFFAVDNSLKYSQTNGVIINVYYEVFTAFTQPPDDLTISSNSFCVQGVAWATEKIEGVYFSVGETNSYGRVSGLSNWSTNLTGLQENSYILKVFGKNESGKSGMTNSLILRYAVPPLIQMNTPSTDITITSNFLSVAGTASDNSGVQAVYVTMDGINYGRPNGVSIWNTNMILHSGANFVKAFSVDLANNSSVTDEAIVTVLGVPEVVIDEPYKDCIINSNSYYLRGRVYDDGQIMGIYVITNEAPQFYVNEGKTWNFQFSGMRYGTNTFDIYAMDSGPNFSLTNRRVIYVLKETCLTNLSVGSGEEYGNSVALSPVSGRLLVGAHLDDSGNGMVYVYTNGSSGWAFEDSFFNTDAGSSDRFGCSVAAVGDGRTAVAGAQGHNSYRGAVYVFTNSPTGFLQTWKLTNADGAASDNFGASVAASTNGRYIVSGAYLKASGAGAVYIFTNSAGGYRQSQKLTCPDGGTTEYGYRVAVSADGSTLAVGAWKYNDTGAVYIYTNGNGVYSYAQRLTVSGAASGDRLGAALALSGNGSVIAVSDTADDSGEGAVYVFTRSGSSYAYSGKLRAFDRDAGDAFGSGVAISGDGSRIAAGASGNDAAGDIDRGSLYFFVKPAGGWADAVEDYVITPANGNADDRFGASVSMSTDGRVTAAGAVNADSGGVNRGAVVIDE